MLGGGDVLYLTHEGWIRGKLAGIHGLPALQIHDVQNDAVIRHPLREGVLHVSRLPEQVDVTVHIQERTGKGNEDKGNILFFRNPVAYKPVAYARDLHFNGVVHYEDKG